ERVTAGGAALVAGLELELGRRRAAGAAAVVPALPGRRRRGHRRRRRRHDAAPVEAARAVAAAAEAVLALLQIEPTAAGRERHADDDAEHPSDHAATLSRR